MMNHTFFENCNSANAVALAIQPEKARNNPSEQANKVSKRFLRSAAVLSEKAFLGWQIWRNEEKQVSTCAIASARSDATNDDFKWIFEGCAVDDRPGAACKDMLEGGRTVYRISSTSGSSKDLYPNRNGFGNMTSPQDIELMFDMLMDADAVILVVAGNMSDAGNQGHGAIYISLPDRMPIRMRYLLSVGFPETRAMEIGESSGAGDAVKPLPEKCLKLGMRHLLWLLIDRKWQGGNQGRSEESIRAEYGTFTPILELDLSLLALNALVKSGVKSVEELRAMSDEDFARLRYGREKVKEEVRRKLAEMAKTAETAKTAVTAKPVPVNAMAKLDELVGLSEVKAQVRKIAALARMKKAMEASGNKDLSITLHMAFVGNPGTAKTTVARIIAGIFYEIGLLPRNEMIEVGRADLVGRYLGQTAPKVKEAFQRAKGGILFIDEAYSLVETYEGGYGGYGDEAINTIVQEMENNRDDTVVVFAGYPDQMEAFFAKNPGLRSRVPTRIAFKGYSADEMVEIAEFEARRKGFSIQPRARKKLAVICEGAAGNAESGNGRFCRNLVEDAMKKYAKRVYGGDAVESAPGFELTAEDFRYPITWETNKKPPIGFN